MITIQKGRLSLPYHTFTYPAGEIGIRLKEDQYNFYYESQTPLISARITDAKEIIQLALIKDALERMKEETIDLYLPYVPFARQDRACVRGESFSLKVFGNFINHLNFHRVIVADPHSDVVDAVFDRLQIIKQIDIVNCFEKLNTRIAAGNIVFLSPDAGSNKKTSEVCKYFGYDEFVRADKLRNLVDGKILETIVYEDDFKQQDICIVDDICDGGKTFIELAKVCRAKNCGKIILYVTHGIFSKGTKELLDNIDEIYTTNSFPTLDTLPQDSRLTILKLEDTFNVFETELR